MIKHKRKLYYNNKGESYFIMNKTRWYLRDISSDGFNLTMFTNIGYWGRYKVVNFEHDIEDYAILEEGRKYEHPIKNL